MKLLKYVSLSLLCVVHCISADIGNVKGTYCILKEPYRSWSVIHGAVAWETGTIRRMYDFGALGKTGRDVSSKTIQLIQRLFYRVPGFDADVDFTITKGIRELDDKVVVQFVADVVVWLSELSQKYEKELEKYKELSLSPCKASQKEKHRIDERLSSLRKTFLSSMKRDESQKVSTLDDKLKYILNAYLECVVQEYMPIYTPHLIIQALLWAKTRGNRDALEVYYTLLEKGCPGCLDGAIDWIGWKHDVFSSFDIKHIEKNFKTDESLEFIRCEQYERFVFLLFAPVYQCPLYPYANTEVSFLGEKDVFPDCMENAIRNMIDMLSYDTKTAKFDVDLLQERLNVNVHESLRLFYEKHADAMKGGECSVRNDWAQNVISNIPHVKYLAFSIPKCNI